MRWSIKEKTFDKNDSLCLKAIFALVIFMHHFLQAAIPKDVFDFGIVSKLGGIGVGAFFIFSTYGLWKTYEKQGASYAKRIFLQKIPALYAVQLVSNLCYLIYVFAANGAVDLSVPRLLQLFGLEMFFGLESLNGSGWFIATIIFIYAAFGFAILISSRCKESRRNLVCFLSACALTLVVMGIFLARLLFPVFGVDGFWTPIYTRSIECVFLGFAFAAFEKPILKFFRGWKYWLALVVTLVLSVVGLFFFIEDFCSLFICCFVLLLCMRLSFGERKILKDFGAISLEFYLLQSLTIGMVPATGLTIVPVPAGLESVVWGFASFGACVLLAYLFSYSRTLVKTLWKKIRAK